MGIIDYVLLILTVLLVLEAINEVRKKNWLALGISLCFLAIVVYMTTPVYKYLWNKVSPPAKASP